MPSEASVALDVKTQELIVKIPSTAIARLVLDNAKHLVQAADVTPEDGNIYVLVTEVYKNMPPAVWLVDTSKMNENDSVQQQLLLWIMEAMERGSPVARVTGADLRRCGFHAANSSSIARALPSVVHAVVVLIED